MRRPIADHDSLQSCVLYFASKVTYQGEFSIHNIRLQVYRETHGIALSYKQVRNALFRMRENPYYHGQEYFHIGRGVYSWI